MRVLAGILQLRGPHPAAAKVLTATGLVMVAALLAVFLRLFRGVEALIAARLYSAGMPTSVDFRGAIVFFGLGQPGGFGLRITPECTSAVLIAPIALVAAGLLSRPRVRWHRVLTGFLAASAVLVIADQLRLGVIAWAVQQFGLQAGFQWSHVVVGSVISLVSAVGALVILVRIAAGEPGVGVLHRN
ncbi:MAG: hypothetical protein ACR2FF_02220 [Mycobacteriales bacterium]